MIFHRNSLAFPCLIEYFTYNESIEKDDSTARLEHLLDPGGRPSSNKSAIDFFLTLSAHDGKEDQNKMKLTKTLSIALLLAAFGASSAMALPNGTQDIKFTGNVIATACQFDLSSAGSGKVDLGDLTKAQVVAGDQWKAFTVKLTGCEAMDVKTVEISSAAATNAGMITSSGTAHGVGIKLADGEGNVYSELTTSGITAATKEFGTYAFKAAMAQDMNNTGGTISTGTVSGTMTITVTYN